MKAIEHLVVQNFLMMTVLPPTAQSLDESWPFLKVAQVYARATSKSVWISVILYSYDVALEKKLFEAETMLANDFPDVTINFRHADLEVMPRIYVKSMIPRGSQLVYSRSHLANNARLSKTSPR